MDAARLPMMLAALPLSVPAHAVTIDLITVGDAGNAADTTGYGAVGEEFRIGKYEVTIGQYAEFLNAAAKSDPYSLYNTSMASDLNTAGILRSGADGAYEYSVMTAAGIARWGGVSDSNRPITYVSWFDAARFANWMHNGQGLGSTETGAYTLNGATSGTTPAVNPGARFFIPTENQWYKAAYYKGGGTNAGYWSYATQSDSQPGNQIGVTLNQVNVYAWSDYAVTQLGSYSSIQNYLTDVGAFTSSRSAYNTFDQSGNVSEWIDRGEVSQSFGTFRGGGWKNTPVGTSSSFRQSHFTSFEYEDLGFRLAAPVPEPSTYLMALAGLACGGYSMFRRRKRTAA